MLHIDGLQQQQFCVSCLVFMAAPQGEDLDLKLKWMFLFFHLSITCMLQ